MSRFIFFLVIFLIIGGLFLHFGYSNCFLKWLGKLPGDFFIRKGRVVIYFPLVSASLASFLICVIVSLFKKKV